MPGKPEIVEVESSSVALKWSAPDSDGGVPLEGYILEYRSEGATRWMTASAEPIREKRFTVGNLKKDLSYEFRVAAQNKAGVGEFSNISSAVKTAEPVGRSKYNTHFSSAVNTAESVGW